MRSLLLLTFFLIPGFGISAHAQDAVPPPPLVHFNRPATPPPSAPAQPIPFDHKLHATTARMTCNDCHAPRGDGTTVAMPQAPKCMTCHASVAADKPGIQSLAAAAKNEDPIAWVRIYRVPSFVTFSHKTHAASACEECHGPVAERTAIALEKDTHMGTCIACHSAKQAPTGCDTCHAIQSKNGPPPFDIDSIVLARLQIADPRRRTPASLPTSAVTMRQPGALAAILHSPKL